NDDADVPAKSRRSNDDVLADVREAFCEIEICRPSEIHRESENINREQNRGDQRGQGGKIVFDEPSEISRQRCHPKRERINCRKVNGRCIYPPRKTVRFAELSAIKSHPAVLLPNEMKNRDKREYAPECKRT